MATHISEKPKQSLDDIVKQSEDKKAEQPQSPLDLAVIDVNNPDELRKLAKQELLYVIERNRGSLGVVTALRELMDRVDGKPAQSVNLDATVRSVTVNAHISFAEMPVRVDNVIEGAVHNYQLIDNE